MRKNRKLACGALAVSVISGVLGIVYLIALGSNQAGITDFSVLRENLILSAVPVLAALGIVMLISTLIMILALPAQKHRM